MFPDAGDDASTVVDQRGVQVDATGYGNNISYTPDDRPAFAIDGNPDTAWRVGAFADVDGERIRFRFDEPVDTSAVNLVQARFGDANRWITQATLTFDGEDELTVDLDESSRQPEGQTISFPKRKFRTLEIRVDGTDVGRQSQYTGLSGVGFSEVRVHDDAPGSPDRHVEEVVRMPLDLGRAAGPDSIDHRLVYSISRARSLNLPPRHNPDERAIVRSFEVPAARDFALAGGARLSSVAADEVLDELLAGATPTPSEIVVTSSARLPGARTVRASAALDGDATTAWTPNFGSSVGQWIEVTTPTPTTLDHLDLQVVADGRHSVPTRLRIEAGGQSRVVDVPPITDGTTVGATTEVPLDFEPVTGSTVRVTVDETRPVQTLDFYSESDIDLPVAHRRARHPRRHRPRADGRRLHPLPERPAHDRRRPGADHRQRLGHRRPRRAPARRADLYGRGRPDAARGPAGEGRARAAGGRRRDHGHRPRHARPRIRGRGRSAPAGGAGRDPAGRGQCTGDRAAGRRGRQRAHEDEAAGHGRDRAVLARAGPEPQPRLGGDRRRRRARIG